MKTTLLRLLIACGVAIVALSLVPLAPAQSASTSPAPYAVTAGPNAYFPPPSDWWELQYYNCIPSSCDDDSGGLVYNGFVQTTASGLCFNSEVIKVGAQSSAANCENPVLLSSSVSVLSRNYYVKLQRKYYNDESLYAQSAVYNEFGVPINIFELIFWCDGTEEDTTPVVGTC